MAKYIVLDSKFNPMSFEDRIAPYKDYYTNAQTQLQAVADLETKAATLKQIADTHPEWQQEYNNYMDMLTNVRDTMYNYGVDGNLVKDVLKANKAFAEMSSMATADGQKRALTEGLNKVVQQDATAFTSIEGEEPTAYDLRKNPYADQYKTMSGAQLQANVESKAKHYAEQMDYPNFYNTDAGILTEEVSRYTPQEMSRQIALIEHLLSDATFASKTPEEQYALLQQYENAGLNNQLLKFVQDELEQSGVSTWSSAAKRKAIHYITNGLWAGVGKNTWDLQKGSSSNRNSSSGITGSYEIASNNPVITNIGNDVWGNTGEVTTNQSDQSFENSTTPVWSEQSSPSENHAYLYDLVDNDDNIHLSDGTTIKFAQALQLQNEISDLSTFVDNTYNQYRKEIQDRDNTSRRELKEKRLLNRDVREQKPTLSKYYNYTDILNEYRTKYDAIISHAKRTVSNPTQDIEKLKNETKTKLEKLFNVNVDDVFAAIISSNRTQSDNIYKTLLSSLDENSLGYIDKKVLEKVKLSNKIQAEKSIQMYNLDKYLTDRQIKNISTYGVRTAYAMDPELGVIQTQLLPVSNENNNTNTTIIKSIESIISSGKSVPIYTTSNNITPSDTEAFTLEELYDDMKKDKDGKISQEFTVYINPAILHYDNYNYNSIIKDCYVLTYKDTKNKTNSVLIPAYALGSDYITTMQKVQEAYDNQSDDNTIRGGFNPKIPTKVFEDIIYTRNQGNN